MGALFEKRAFVVGVANNDILGVLADAHLGLYRQSVPANESTVKADITAHIANFDGYAEANIDWSTPSIGDDGQVEVVGTVPEFRPTGNNIDNGIVGAFVTKNSDDSLLMFGEFDQQPVQMNTVQDSMVIIVRYRPRSNSLLLCIS